MKMPSSLLFPLKLTLDPPEITPQLLELAFTYHQWTLYRRGFLLTRPLPVAEGRWCLTSRKILALPWKEWLYGCSKSSAVLCFPCVFSCLVFNALIKATTVCPQTLKNSQWHSVFTCFLVLLLLLFFFLMDCCSVRPTAILSNFNRLAEQIIFVKLLFSKLPFLKYCRNTLLFMWCILEKKIKGFFYLHLFWHSAYCLLKNALSSSLSFSLIHT